MKTLIKKWLAKRWLKKYGIINYIINANGEIDVDGGVDLSNCGLTELPSFIQFGTVKGYFTCGTNNLTSLRGCPRVVKKNFYCHGNNLTTLKGSPEKVKGYFHCSFNNLTTLEGAPKK